MASTLSHKWLTIFLPKPQNFVYFLSYDFVQISPAACCPNTHQIMYGRLIKCPIGKSIFAVNLPLNSSVLPLQMWTLEIYSLFIHYLIRTWTKWWRNLNQIVSCKMYKILRFLTKLEFLKPFFDKVLTPFCRRFRSWNSCLMANY